ncbi:MAG: hydantoinase B/oxoprolinase family protein, partial [bacterium]
SFGNLIRATAEINESIFPSRQLWRDYRTDSGGAGEYRGGCGSLYRKQVLVPATVYTYVVGRDYPMPGIAGGMDGAPNRLLTKVRKRGEGCEVGILSERVEHEAGECYEYYYGGGGGWGDPLRRPPARVLDDVLDEYVSVEAAARDYGVVLRGSLEKLTLRIDHPATEVRRNEIAQTRKEDVA